MQKPEYSFLLSPYLATFPPISFEEAQHPVLDHVVSARGGENLGDMRPLPAYLADSLDEFDVFLEGPFSFGQTGVEVVLPHLPAAAG